MSTWVGTMDVLCESFYRPTEQKINFLLTIQTVGTITLPEECYSVTEIMKMDIKNLEGTRFHSTDTIRGRKAPVQADKGSSAPTERVADDTTDLSNTARVVGVGRAEAMKLHQHELERIAADIESGTYSADLNIVAERVAQILLAKA